MWCDSAAGCHFKLAAFLVFTCAQHLGALRRSLSEDQSTTASAKVRATLDVARSEFEEAFLQRKEAAPSTENDFKKIVLSKSISVKAAASTNARANGKDWGKMSWQERLAEIVAAEQLLNENKAKQEQTESNVQMTVKFASGIVLTFQVSKKTTGADVKALSQKDVPVGIVVKSLKTEDGRLVGDDEQVVAPNQTKVVLHANIGDWNVESVPVTVMLKSRDFNQKVVINLSASDTGDKVKNLLQPFVVSKHAFTSIDRLYFASGTTAVNVGNSKTLLGCGFVPGQQDLIAETSKQLGMG